jgi:hypothetical protein
LHVARRQFFAPKNAQRSNYRASARLKDLDVKIENPINALVIAAN